MYILSARALASYRRRPLSSNVRPTPNTLPRCLLLSQTLPAKNCKALAPAPRRGQRSRPVSQAAVASNPRLVAPKAAAISARRRNKLHGAKSGGLKLVSSSSRAKRGTRQGLLSPEPISRAHAVVNSRAVALSPVPQLESAKGCGLTLRSSRAPTAGHQGQPAGTVYIVRWLALASHRWCRLTSNVRPHTSDLVGSERVSISSRKT